MPRQTFLARESFVDAGEQQTRESLRTIADHLPNVSFLAENRIVDSMRFSYEKFDKKSDFFIDVTILPLNDQYTRVSMHASYSNGHAFYEGSDLAFALHDFESAIHAALKGELSQYLANSGRKIESGTFLSFYNDLRVFIFQLFFKKKLS